MKSVVSLWCGSQYTVKWSLLGKIQFQVDQWYTEFGAANINVTGTEGQPGIQNTYYFVPCGSHAQITGYICT